MITVSMSKHIKSQLTGRAETVIVGEVLADGVGKVEKVVPLVFVDDLDWLFDLVKCRNGVETLIIYSP